MPIKKIRGNLTASANSSFDSNFSIVNGEVVPLKRGRGKPPGSTNKKKEVITPSLKLVTKTSKEFKPSENVISDCDYDFHDRIARSPIVKLSRDIKNASRLMSQSEVRFLVSNYYRMQKNRIRTAAQAKELGKVDQPNEMLSWLSSNNQQLEKGIKESLDIYTMNHPVGIWMRSIWGVGPVIAAGLLSHIDIEKAPTVGHIWSFAGLLGDKPYFDQSSSVPNSRSPILSENGLPIPHQSWNKGEKRPWNAELKTLCWKLGQSFIKVSGKEDSFYGQLYLARKAYETEQNELGTYAAKANQCANRVGKETVAYSYNIEGKLSPSHIVSRSSRYATKIFLSHLHHIWYKIHFNKEPPAPFAIAILGHAHYIDPMSIVS